MTDTPPAPQTEEAAPPAPGPKRGLLGLVLKLGLLFAAAYATVLALVWVVPEGNDYGRATVLKHDRLASLASPKIVLVGGSNLSFGIDSPMIERATGCPVVNMGINGYFGSRYMLEEVRPFLRPGDMVVVAFEYDNYFKSVDGTPSDLLVVIKNNPVAFTYLTREQQLSVLARAPFVAHQKMLRLLGEGVVAVKESVMGPAHTEEQSVDIEAIESYASFTPEGDLVAHLGVAWPFAREQGILADAVDPEIIGLMRDYAADMEARQVDMMVSYTSLEQTFYGANQAAIDNVHALITAAPPLHAPSPPSNYVFPDSMFFDTVYHLGAEGRALRTQRLIQDIEAQFDTQDRCGSTRTAQAGE